MDFAGVTSARPVPTMGCQQAPLPREPQRTAPDGWSSPDWRPPESSRPEVQRSPRVSRAPRAATASADLVLGRGLGPAPGSSPAFRRVAALQADLTRAAALLSVRRRPRPPGSPLRRRRRGRRPRAPPAGPPRGGRAPQHPDDEGLDPPSRSTTAPPGQWWRRARGRTTDDDEHEDGDDDERGTRARWTTAAWSPRPRRRCSPAPPCGLPATSRRPQQRQAGRGPGRRRRRRLPPWRSSRSRSTRRARRWPTCGQRRQAGEAGQRGHQGPEGRHRVDRQSRSSSGSSRAAPLVALVVVEDQRQGEEVVAPAHAGQHRRVRVTEARLMAHDLRTSFRSMASEIRFWVVRPGEHADGPGLGRARGVSTGSPRATRFDPQSALMQRERGRASWMSSRRSASTRSGGVRRLRS